MKRINYISLTAFLLFLIISGCTDSKIYTEINGYAQGGTFHIICSIPEKKIEEQLVKAVNDTILAIDNSVSGYNKGSILSKVNAGEDQPLDAIFTDLFLKSKEIWDESDGYFDPSAAPLFDLWGFGFKEKSNVPSNQIDSVMQFVGMDKVSLIKYDDGKMHLKKGDPRLSLNFNAIAQGYTCDVIAAVLESYGSSDYIVELGGEIVCRGNSSRGDLWRIWIDKPVDGNNEAGKLEQEIISITDCGVVTSGNYRKYYVENGHKYSHTIDPKTGYPVDHTMLSATAIAKDGATADAYATWFMVVGLEKAKQILSLRSDIMGYFVYGDQDDMKVWHSEGLKLDNE